MTVKYKQSEIITDVEFMFDLSESTQYSIKRFSKELENSNDKLQWIRYYDEAKNNVLTETKAISIIKDSHHTIFKKCFALIYHQNMTEQNANEIREKFVQYKKDFESYIKLNSNEY